MELNANAKLVTDFFATVLAGQRDVAAVDRFLSPTFVDHDPAGDDAGPAGVKTKLEGLWRALPDGRYELLQIVAEGDLVAVLSRLLGGKQPVDFADFYRVERGRITEHWHVVDSSALGAALS